MDTRSIIYVENELSMANLVYKQLTRKGYDVTVASLGQDAVRLVQAHPEKYRLLITDLNLTDIKGIKVAELIKESCPGIHVLIATGDVAIDEQGLKKSTDIDEVIYKPFLFSEFFKTVNRLLKEESHEPLKH